MGGETTSLDTKGKAKTEESKDVKSRTYRTNIIISLDCFGGVPDREETLQWSSGGFHSEQEATRRVIFGKPCERTAVSGKRALSTAWSDFKCGILGV